MASLINDPNGRRRIQFTAPDGKRKAVRLGKVTKKHAQTVKTKVEALISAAITGGVWDDETSRWVADLSDELADKLATVGLIPKRGSKRSYTLGEWLEEYISGRAIKKENTRRNYEVSRKHLINHFGSDCQLAEITAGDADEWRENLLRTLSPATVSREVKRAKQFFRAAARRRLIPSNPFADLPSPAQVNSSREHFVTCEQIEKVIAACPDAEWRLIVALSRFAGLRCPSETLLLRWGDVDWDNSRITVHSPKTEHHVGGESRVIPLFPELRPYLETLFFDEERTGTEYVITRYRARNSNLRTQFSRIVKRASVDPWPRLFHAMKLHVKPNWPTSFQSMWYASGWETVNPWQRSTTCR